MQMPSPPTAESGATSVLQARVDARQRGIRRRRLLHRLALFVFVSLAMILLAIFTRDVQARRRLHADAAEIARGLQVGKDAGGALPLRLPDDRDGAGRSEQYYLNLLYPQQLQSRSLVGVAAQRRAADMFLLPAGRAVVVFDGERFRPRWLTEAEFAAQAVELGLRGAAGQQ